jgi:ABC-2 type transport system permease protein
VSDILIIARREFLQYIRTRGFLLTLFFIPAWFVLGGIFQHVATETKSLRYFAVVDETGRFTGALDRALTADAERASFRAFALWAEANVERDQLRQAPELAALLAGDGNDAATLARFAQDGGSAGLLPKVRPLLRPGAAAFIAPVPDLQRVELPDDLAAAVKSQDRGALQRALKGAITVPALGGAVPLFAVAVIPAGFSMEAPHIEYWGENQTDPAVQEFLRRALLDELRLQTAAKTGLAPAAVHKLLETSVALERFNPVSAAGNGVVTRDDILRIMLPFGVALLLLVAILSISSMLLMAVIEEKSNRVIELILASTSPYRLMTGKLLGAAGAAIILMAGWILGAGGAMSLLAHASPSEILAALMRAHALSDLPAMALCFLCGLAIHTTIFLGVGAMARSFQEAQSYLGPLLFILFAPLGFVTFVYNEPNGLIATLLSFSPLHAPFFLMMRLPNNPPPLSTALAFVWMILWTLIILRLMTLGFVRFILPGEQTVAVLPGLLRRFLRIRRRAS